MIDTPKLSFPFEPGVYREQDSPDEIMDCVEILLGTEVGERMEVPLYGIPDQTFRQGGADVIELLRIIGVWEPRASTEIDPGTLENRVQEILVKIRSGRG